MTSSFRVGSLPRAGHVVQTPRWAALGELQSNQGILRLDLGLADYTWVQAHSPATMCSMPAGRGNGIAGSHLERGRCPTKHWTLQLGLPSVGWTVSGLHEVGPEIGTSGLGGAGPFRRARRSGS